MGAHSIPDSVVINNKTYPIKFLCRDNTPHDYGYVFIDENPIISIEFFYGKPLPDALKRAEFAIRSYEELKGTASLIPASAYSCWSDEHYTEVSSDEHYQKQLSMPSLMDVELPSTTVEAYSQFGVPHLCVTFNANTDNEQKFCIWDRNLIISVAERHNKKVGQRSRGYLITSETPAFEDILRHII